MARVNKNASKQQSKKSPPMQKEVVWKCSYCSRSFKVKRSKKNHMMTHHTKLFCNASATGDEMDMEHLHAADEQSAMRDNASSACTKTAPLTTSNPVASETFLRALRGAVNSVALQPKIENPSHELISAKNSADEVPEERRPFENPPTPRSIPTAKHGCITLKLPKNTPILNAAVLQPVSVDLVRASQLQNTHLANPNPFNSETLESFNDALSNESIRRTVVEETPQKSRKALVAVASNPLPTMKVIPQNNNGFNLTLLDRYDEGTLDETYVQRKYTQICNSISNYDDYVRGKLSNQEVRNQLRMLDHITPLTELPEIFRETDAFLGSYSHLISLLRIMFEAPNHVPLSEKLQSMGSDMRELSLSHLIRSCLGYMVHAVIFSAIPSQYVKSIRKGGLEGLENLFGDEFARKINQFMRLNELKHAEFKRYLETRARTIAEQFYCTLYPISHWLPHSPNNIKHEHIGRLLKIARQSLLLANELDARGGFFFPWRPFKSSFDPDNLTTEGSQQVDMESMRDSQRRKQKVKLMLMCEVRRKLPGDETIGQYAKGLVILQMPYADSTPHSEHDSM